MNISALDFFSLWRVKPWNSILWKLVSAMRSSQVEWCYPVGCVHLFNKFVAVRPGSNESLPVLCPIVFFRLVKNLRPKQTLLNSYVTSSDGWSWPIYYVCLPYHNQRHCRVGYPRVSYAFDTWFRSAEQMTWLKYVVLSSSWRMPNITSNYTPAASFHIHSMRGLSCCRSLAYSKASFQSTI